MEDEIPLVPEMSPEEKQILADLEREFGLLAALPRDLLTGTGSVAACSLARVD